MGEVAVSDVAKRLAERWGRHWEERGFDPYVIDDPPIDDARWWLSAIADELDGVTFYAPSGRFDQPGPTVSAWLRSQAEQP